MNSFIKSTPIVLILILCSNNVYSEPVKLEGSEIRFHYPNNLKSNGFKLNSTSERFAKFAEAANVEHIPTGANARINAKITASVSRAGVLAGVGALVRQGAKLGKRAVPYVGTALLAYDIYETFKEDIQSQGYQYDPETDKFLKYYPAQNCLWDRDGNGNLFYIGCYGVDSSILMKYDRRVPAEDPEIQELMNSRMESLARPYFNKTRDRRTGYLSTYSFSKCVFDWNGGSCGYGPKGDERNFGSFQLMLRQRYKEEMSAQNLEQILAAKVDANPDKFIRATNFPGYKEDVEVAPGTKVNIGPVTDKSGNPVQVLVSFGRDSQGKTTADVQVTPRPDLTPGSAEAPNVRPLPDTSPATNPSNNPNPNENPGTRPNPEPDPDTNPEPNLQPGTSPGSPVLPGKAPANGRDGKDGQDGKDGKDGGFLCRYFPTILACQEMGKPSDGMFDDITIPQVTDDKTWSSDDFLPSNGVCPQPKTFHVLGKRYEASYQPLCVFAEKIRFAVLLAFIIMSAFVVFGSLRKE